jgi:ParB-like chromosome segregation protein Spo0J
METEAAMSKADKDKLAAGGVEIREAEQEAKQKAARKGAFGGNPGADGESVAEHIAKAKVGALAIHPIAKLFPPLPAKEMRELKASIEAEGIKVPILVNKTGDTILDGRNRWLVAQDLGLKDIPFEVFKGTEEEIAGEVLARNVFRRHLTPDQRVAAITQVRAPQLEAEAQERKLSRLRKGDKIPVSQDSGSRETGKADPGANSSQSGKVADKIAAEADVGRHKAEQALKARKAGQLPAVIERKKSLKAAADAEPKKPRKPKWRAKEKTLDDQVWDRWSSFLKKFSPAERRLVKDVVRALMPIMLKQDEKGLAVIAKTMAKFKQRGLLTTEALGIVRGFLEDEAKAA